MDDEASQPQPLAGVTELPLFPLGQVLFPHMLMPLHIFEERYKEMVSRCVRESIPFGVVLLAESGDSDTPENGTSRIGCTARIRRVERLPDGCMNIEVVGEQRFRILETHEVQAYRTGLAEPLQDEPGAPEAVKPLAEDVQRLLREFLVRQLALLGQRDLEIELPELPELLSFTAACVLPLENEEKQAFLEETDTAARLHAERAVLQREVAKLRRASDSVDVTFVQVTAERFKAFVCEN